MFEGNYYVQAGQLSMPMEEVRRKGSRIEKYMMSPGKAEYLICWNGEIGRNDLEWWIVRRSYEIWNAKEILPFFFFPLWVVIEDFREAVLHN